MGIGAEKRQCLSPAFFFVLEKGSKSAGNAVIPTYPTHWSHGLQYLRYKRPMFAFVGESGYTRHHSPEPRTQRLTRRNRWRFGWGWYHYPQRALRAVETPDGRLSKRLICRFLRSGRRSSPHDSCFLANTQNFLPTAPVANAFTLWYDKFDKLEVLHTLFF